jgi:hypothetical protein
MKITASFDSTVPSPLSLVSNLVYIKNIFEKNYFINKQQLYVEVYNTGSGVDLTGFQSGLSSLLYE